ncbi:MAG: hypothetical protein AB4911_14185 [Oscillochloridaceae bacterium umkhey_bin13]
MHHLLRWLLVLCLSLWLLEPTLTKADSVPQPLPLSQDWHNTALIMSNDNWDNLPGIVGMRGDGLTSSPGIDPQTVLATDDSGVLDVNANQTNPNSFATGGVTEFQLADPVVAIKGSATARAPYLRLSLNTLGKSDLQVAYRLRDLDGSSNHAVQPVALHYRIGASGPWTNVPAAFVADATEGPNLASLVTSVAVDLPVTANDQPLLQLRIMTTDAVGTDEWVGIDDILITGQEPSPTVVTLLEFRAAPDGEAVRLDWATASEYAIAGFVVLRGTHAEYSHAVAVSELVAGEGDNLSGAAYTWHDPAPAPTAFYWLEVINCDGTPESYGPVWVNQPAALRSAHQVFLPLVGR